MPDAPATPARRPTRAWALERLDRAARPCADLAAHAADERAHLHPPVPRGDRAVGDPAGWSQQRVEQARHLLETTDVPVDRVATDAGFGTPASLRQHLHAAIGVAPLAYRRTFRGDRSLTRCDVSLP